MAFPSDCKDLNPEHSSKPRVSILRHYDEDMDDTMDIKSLEHRIERGEKLVPLFRAMSAVQSNVYEPFLEFDHKAVTMHRCRLRSGLRRDLCALRRRRSHDRR
jgi:hypothetical protein